MYHELFTQLNFSASTRITLYTWGKWKFFLNDIIRRPCDEHCVHNNIILLQIYTHIKLRYTDWEVLYSYAFVYP